MDFSTNKEKDWEALIWLQLDLVGRVAQGYGGVVAVISASLMCLKPNPTSPIGFCIKPTYQFS